MGMKLEPYREFWRRHHRVLGLYLTLEAWKRGLDCIVLERNDVQTYLKLKRIEGAHVRWLREDLTPWFKHQVLRTRKGAHNSFHSLYLSRVPLDEAFFRKPMLPEERVKEMGERGLKAGTLLAPEQTVRLGEEEILPRLAALATGLKDP
jgi:hypothetical protein